MLDSKIEKVRLHFGIEKIEDWTTVKPAWLLQMEGVGPATLNFIRMHLAARGVTLANDRTPEFWRLHLKDVRLAGGEFAESEQFDIAQFTIVVDTQEELPWHFENLRGNSSRRGRPLIVPTKRQHLETGDYSILEMEQLITVERKSLGDLYKTLTHERKRFERELIRMQRMEYAAVVVEADWLTVLTDPPTGASPESIFGTIVAWQQRYRGTHWWLCHTRAFAELTCYRILERFWEDRAKTVKGKSDEVPIPFRQPSGAG